MIKRIFILVFLVINLTIFDHCFGWGFWAHKKISRTSISALPPEMRPLYEDNADYITEHSVYPDKKRSSDSTEGAHHYIDIDKYGKYPYPGLPHQWAEAAKKFTADTLNKYGVVPWYINTVYQKLVQAFKDKDADKILSLSAEL